MTSSVYCLPDGRNLGYTTIGKGAPVIYFHGTASSRLEVLLLRKLAETFSLQIIGVDRPGFGLSAYKPRKSIRDFTSDINSLADHLGFERFSLLGWSGGGVFALAYNALYPNRIAKAVVAASPALPFDVSTAHNMPLARYLMKISLVGRLAMWQLSSQLIKANGDPNAFLASKQGKQLLKGYSTSDLSLLSNPEWRRLMYQSMVEAFHQGDVGVKAVVDEHKLFIKTWNLPLSMIAGSKLYIWHGGQDMTIRVSNAYAIAKEVPDATIEIFPNSGHFVMFEHLERLGKIFFDE